MAYIADMISRMPITIPLNSNHPFPLPSAGAILPKATNWVTKKVRSWFCISV